MGRRAVQDHLLTTREAAPRLDDAAPAGAEEALRRSEEQYRRIVEMANEGIVHVDPMYRIVTANRRFADMLGYSVQELLGQSALAVIAEEHHAAARERWTRRLQGDHSDIHYDLKLRRKDGVEIWAAVSASVLTDGQGQLLGTLAMLTDITARKRAEEELQRREEQYRQIVETAQEGIVQADGDNVITFVNRKLADMLGYEVDELMGLPLIALVAPDARAAVEANQRRRREGYREDYLHDLKLRTKGGADLWVMVSSTPVFDAAGHFKGGTALLLDITARKRAEEALHQSEAQFRNLYENVPVGVALVSTDGHLLMANPCLQRILGYDEDELKRMTFAEFTHPDDVAADLRLFGEVVAGVRESYTLEKRYIRRDGRIVWGELIATATRDQDDAPDKLIGILFDVTERHEAAERLQQSEERYRLLIETAQEGVWQLDAAGRTTFVNARLADMLGYTVDHMLGRHLWTFVPDEERDAMRRRVLGQCDDSYADELQFERKDGSRMWARFQFHPLLDEHGGSRGLLAMLLDVTARRHAEEMRRRSALLEEENRRVLEESRLKSSFLANMSHELRTPLTAIAGFAEFLYDGRAGALSADHQQLVGNIFTSARHLMRIVNDILDLAKIEAGKTSFRPERVHIAQTVSEVRDVPQSLTREKQLRIVTRVDSTLGVVELDPGRLKQVLYNFLSNAIKVSPVGARITVTVTAEGDEKFRVSVHDRGPGIAPVALRELFREFVQLDKTGRADGTGLGLAVTKRIVEAQGGTVGVRSTVGKGSTFYAVLPRRPRFPVE